MDCCRVWLLTSCVFFFFGGSFSVRAQLPIEATLPNQQTRRADLPAESELPSSLSVVARQAESAAASALPGESELPTAAVGAQVDAAQVDAEPAASPLDLARSADQRAWLRLALRGHVGTVRTITFSGDGTRLHAAGDDKHVITWLAGEDNAWRYERTIRWQVQRGDQGRIYALSALDGRLALGGLAADGANGEVLLVDPETGELQTPLIDEKLGHTLRLTGLASSTDNATPAVASMDVDGRLLYWRPDETGQWRAQLVSFDQATSTQLQFWRTLHPIAMQGATSVFAADYAGANQKGEATWKIAKWTLQGGGFAKQLIAPQAALHNRMVTAIASAKNAPMLASADESGSLFIWWDLTSPPLRLPLKSPATMLGFSDDGSRLVAGTAGATGIPAEVLLWDTSQVRIPRRLSVTTVQQQVLAGAISPDGEYVAFGQGGDVVVRPTDPRGNQSTVLTGNVKPPTQVAFARAEPYYRVAIGHGDVPSAPLDSVFNPYRPQLEAQAIDASDWLMPTTSVGGWTVNHDGTKAWLQVSTQRAASLALDPRIDGLPTAWCWLTNDDGKPYAVAVGTSASNNIFVFAPSLQGEAKLLRQFRGHWARVNSIAVSADRRYLASASRDGTIRFWPLDGLSAGDQINLWGATFKAEDGVVVDTIREDGPLYFRGIRRGDRIAQLRLPRFDENRRVLVTNVDAEAAILETLSSNPPAQLVAFDYRRAGVDAEPFQSYPAWQPIASLAISTEREWAFWTPAGFYDASFEGHKLFGWQVNRGPRRLPDFFLAAQVRRFLERPDVMSQLLETGSAESAFRSVKQMPPANWSSVVTNQNLFRPHVAIIEPRPGETVDTDSLTVSARISVNEGLRIIPPKLFVNGVVGLQRRLLDQRSASGRTELNYQWQVQAPADDQLLIQVTTATDEEVVGQDHVLVKGQSNLPREQPRLFVVAAGINQYPDAQIPSLSYAVDNALGVMQTLDEKSRQLYDLRGFTLLNENVTKPMWGVMLEAYAKRIGAQATPDDLLVIYLSGHGVRDDQTDDYYFISADARYADVVARRYADCLSISDFDVFSAIPCRKLVVLDTCHSGAVQPTTQRDLKAALRLLQDDFFFTMTASEGSQEAIEDRGKRLGRFTHHLLQSLRGGADQRGDGDGIVTFRESIEYVKRAVVADSRNDADRQHPTAGPADIIELSRIPLTAVSN